MKKSASIIALVGVAAVGLLGSFMAYGLAQTSTNGDSSDTNVAILSAGEVHLQDRSSGIISVNGYAETIVDPDLFVAKLGVSITEDTTAEALDENRRVMDEVIKAIQSVGVAEDEIRISNISIDTPHTDEQNSFDSPSFLVTGYSVSNMVTVTTDNLALAADILDTAIEAGVDRVESADFILSPDTKKLVQERLFVEATSDAKHKAEVVLAQLDQEIIGVESVTVDIKDEIEQVTNVLDPITSLLAGKGGPMPTLSSDQMLETSIVVTFLIGPK